MHFGGKVAILILFPYFAFKSSVRHPILGMSDANFEGILLLG